MSTVYVTAPPDAAQSIAKTLVEERLAACVNRVPCRSTYRWEGDVRVDDEDILVTKTTDERYSALVNSIEACHPYDVPCIEHFDEEQVHPSFRSWCETAVDESAE